MLFTAYTLIVECCIGLDLVIGKFFVLIDYPLLKIWQLVNSRGHLWACCCSKRKNRGSRCFWERFLPVETLLCGCQVKKEPTVWSLCFSIWCIVFFFVLTYLLFFCTRNRIPSSPQENLILGLNLLRLLVQNRIAEFHTELELLSSATLEDPCIKHAVELEQSFMEGAYNRVLSARQTAPDATYVYFMDLLAKTIR